MEETDTDTDTMAPGVVGNRFFQSFMDLGVVYFQTKPLETKQLWLIDVDCR